MKKPILLIAVLLALLGAVYSFTRPMYRAEFCGNIMVRSDEVSEAISLVNKQGCNDAIVYEVADELVGDAYVVYGVKIVAPDPIE